MNPDTSLEPTALGNRQRELSKLDDQVAAMRAVLIRLLQDVVQAESQLDNAQAAQLLEANEQLVLAAVRNQGEADTATQALEEVSRSAALDPLTHLPNRVLLLDRFEHAIAHARRHGTRAALLFADINRFKQINDSFGHTVGDQVLVHVARCFTDSVRAEDTVSRHGGDEFLILLSDVMQAGDANAIAEKLLASINAPKRIGQHLIPLAASIGISLYPDDGEDAQTLIELADAAMYRAKRLARGGYLRHGEQAPPAVAAPRSPSRHEQTLAEHEQRHAMMQEANQQLVLAGLDAQELQAAAERAQQRQLDFLAIIAHELRDPLAPIRIATAMLGRVSSDEPLLPRARAIIERQVENMARLVGDLLDASRVGKGKLSLEQRPINLADIVADAVATCSPAMDARQHQLELTLPDGPVPVNGDALRLVQVLNNLLINAAKYTPVGGSISLLLASADRSATLTVADNGIGITAEALPQIFDPFVQDVHAIGFNGFSLGIGLTVVREIVQAHGGSVVASSAGRGLGSRFVITLPLLPTP